MARRTQVAWMATKIQYFKNAGINRLTKSRIVTIQLLLGTSICCGSSALENLRNERSENDEDIFPETPKNYKFQKNWKYQTWNRKLRSTSKWVKKLAKWKLKNRCKKSTAISNTANNDIDRQSDSVEVVDVSGDNDQIPSPVALEEVFLVKFRHP